MRMNRRAGLYAPSGYAGLYLYVHGDTGGGGGIIVTSTSISIESRGFRQINIDLYMKENPYEIPIGAIISYRGTFQSYYGTPTLLYAPNSNYSGTAIYKKNNPETVNYTPSEEGYLRVYSSGYQTESAIGKVVLTNLSIGGIQVFPGVVIT